MRSPALCLLAGAWFLSVPASLADLTFQHLFTNQALADFTAAEQALIVDEVNFWDGIIDGYRDGSSRTWTVTFDSYSEAAVDNVTSSGLAALTGLNWSGYVPGSHTSNGYFIISTSADVSFNIHPDAGALNPINVRHEIGHALGIGSLWEDNELYNDGVAGNSNRTLAGGTPGHLLGPATLAAYQAEFDPSAIYVPVELDGPEGTSHRHWNEADTTLLGDSGSAAIAIGGSHIGQSLDHELMSGEISDPGWLSETTRANLFDLGYITYPVPEPGSFALCCTAAVFGLRRRRP